MEQLNQVQLRGYIGNIRIQNVGGSKVARFSVATNLAYRGQDGCCIIETTWHNVVAWEGKDIIDLDKLLKGTSVEITGRIRNQRYTGEDGIDRYSTEILARSLCIITDPLKMQE